jgi:serine/threonine-protein kinase
VRDTLAAMAGPELPTGIAPGAIVGGRYRVVRLIGGGGMGVVLEAETANRERVALKLLSADGAQHAEARARFEREATLSSQLRAPHVVPVRDYGIDPGTQLPFLMMDLLLGEDLESLVKRVGPLDPDVTVKLFRQACDGLMAAHALGIVHRDVKPSNIFLCGTPGGMVDVRVCDFGAAKQAGGRALTAAGSLIGTPLFMAPEQLANPKAVDPRADVWGLSMSLYFALAGRAALDHVQTFAQLVTALTTGGFPAVQDAAPWVDPGLARVVHAGLLASLDARWPSMRDLAVALERRVGGDDAVPWSGLTAVPPGTRALMRPRAPLPASWSDVRNDPPAAPAPSAPRPMQVSTHPSGSFSQASAPAVSAPRRTPAVAIAIAIAVFVVVIATAAAVAWHFWQRRQAMSVALTARTSAGSPPAPPCTAPRAAPSPPASSRCS